MAVLVHRGHSLGQKTNMQKHKSSIQSWGSLQVPRHRQEAEAWGGCWARDMGWVLRSKQDPISYTSSWMPSQLRPSFRGHRPPETEVRGKYKDLGKAVGWEL